MQMLCHLGRGRSKIGAGAHTSMNAWIQKNPLRVDAIFGGLASPNQIMEEFTKQYRRTVFAKRLVCGPAGPPALTLLMSAWSCSSIGADLST